MLFVIDPEPYRIALAQADAALAARGSTSSSCAPPIARRVAQEQAAAGEVDYLQSQLERRPI